MSEPLAVRVVVPADAAAIQAIYAPIVRDTVISFENEPPSVEEVGRRIERVTETYPWLVAERGGALAGYAYARKHRERAAYRWSVDTSIYVRSDARRGGVGRRLYHALFAVLAHQGFSRAFAGITLPNPGSVGLHEAMGFARVGVYERVGFKMGAWRDVGWWQRDLAKLESPPSEPVQFREIAKSPEVATRLRSLPR